VSQFTADYQSQLPKRKKVSVGGTFNAIATGTGILSFATLFIQQKWSASLIYPVGLLVILASMLVYLVISVRGKRNYDDTILHLHFVSHLIRDTISDFRRGNNPDLRDLVLQICNSVAQAFSLVTGKNCRVSIKMLEDDLTIRTYCRDNFSSLKAESVDNDLVLRLNDNTDFHDLWYAQNRCSRYFFCNDLPRLWMNRMYRTSSFKYYKREPVHKSILGANILLSWPLPYKSTIVWPIRYAPGLRPPAHPTERAAVEDWYFWGFLCVDCPDTGAFKERIDPELGAAVADQLYILLEELQAGLTRRDSPP
jgi:hypothetical protein